MEKPNEFDKGSLLERLESYKSTFRKNAKQLEEDRLLKEQVHHRLMMAESQMYEITMWERVKDQAKYYCSLEEANRILAALAELIEEMHWDNDFRSDANIPG